MLSQWLLSASLLASGAAALLIQPTNTTQNSDVVELVVANTDFGALQPLTQSASVNLNVILLSQSRAFFVFQDGR
jgi:hypothetical protein